MDMSDMSSSMTSMASAMSSMSSMLASATATATATATDMAGMTMSTATSAATASSTAMSMSMSSSSSSCKISMLWNWYTIDACFIAKSWHITSRGMFAGSCIGCIFFVMALELVRRMHREYDRYIVNEWKNKGAIVKGDEMQRECSQKTAAGRQLAFISLSGKSQGYSGTFHPTIVQQTIRAIFYTLSFGAGYLIMLLAMYYNGYIIICLFIGAFLGYLLFGSDGLADGLNQAQQGGCC